MMEAFIIKKNNKPILNKIDYGHGHNIMAVFAN